MQSHRPISLVVNQWCQSLHHTFPCTLNSPASFLVDFANALLPSSSRPWFAQSDLHIAAILDTKCITSTICLLMAHYTNLGNTPMGHATNINIVSVIPLPLAHLRRPQDLASPTICLIYGPQDHYNSDPRRCHFQQGHLTLHPILIILDHIPKLTHMLSKSASLMACHTWAYIPWCGSLRWSRLLLAIPLPCQLLLYQPTTSSSSPHPTGPGHGVHSIPIRECLSTQNTFFLFSFFSFFDAPLSSWAVCEIPSSHHTCVTTAHITPHQHAPLCPPCHHSQSTWAVATS